MKTFREIFDQKKVSGEVGIEVEVEGRNLPTNLKSYWRRIEDHSLRGESAEYCLKGPMKRTSYPASLEYLNKKFKEAGTVIEESYRTSVHIHINVQELGWITVYNFLLLYFILEECLIEFCGEDRKGYCFCLTAKDAEWLIVSLRDIAIRKDWWELNSNDLRYSALNVCSLYKFGSLEFRGMRGTTDTAVLIKWTDTLLKLKDASKLFKNPVEILSMFSLLGPRRFVEKVLEDKSDIIFSVDDWEGKCYEGVERVQSIAYEVKWKDEAKKTKKKRMPVPGGFTAAQLRGVTRGEYVERGLNPFVGYAAAGGTPTTMAWTGRVQATVDAPEVDAPPPPPHRVGWIDDIVERATENQRDEEL